MKRREKKKVELREGHLVLDLPVARSLAQLGNQAGGIEGESGKLRCTFFFSFLLLRESVRREERERKLIQVFERWMSRYGCDG